MYSGTMTKPPYWGTRIRAVRVPDELWDAAKATAAARAAAGVEGETVTAVITRALENYVRKHRRGLPWQEKEG